MTNICDLRVFCKVKELPVVPNFIRFPISLTDVLFNIFKGQKKKMKFK